MKKRTETTYYFSTEEIEKLTGYLISNSWGEIAITKYGIDATLTKSVHSILNEIKYAILDKADITSRFWELTIDVQSQAPEFHLSNPVRILMTKAYVNAGLEIEDME